MEKKLFFVAVAILVSAFCFTVSPYASAQAGVGKGKALAPPSVPKVPEAVCAYCGVRVTSSTQPWDHKTTCPYYQAKPSGTSSYSHSHSHSHSPSSTEMMRSAITGAVMGSLASALTEAIASSNDYSMSRAIEVARVSGKYEVRTRRSGDGNYVSRVGVWDTERNDWYIRPIIDMAEYNDDLYPLVSGDIKVDSRNDGYGIIVPVGNYFKEVILCNYSSLDNVGTKRGGPYIVAKNGVYGVVGYTVKGKKYIETRILPIQYKKIVSLECNDMMGVNDNGKWGVANSTGMIISPVYENIGRAFELDGRVLFPVESNGVFGLVDTTGTVVIPFRYDGLKHFWNDMYFACKNGKWGIILYPDGKIFIPFKYDELGGFGIDRQTAQSVGMPVSYIYATKKLGNGSVSGLYTFSGELIIPVKYPYDKLEEKAILYPRTSFNYFYHKYLSEHPWSAKGEFETTEEYNARINDVSRQGAFVLEKKEEACKAFLNVHMNDKNNSFRYDIGPYDADKGAFTLTNNAIPGESYILEVPGNEAKAFKECFSSIQDSGVKSSECFVLDDSFALGKVTFTTPDGKSYTYINPEYKK
jgi:hypothetical protein